MTESLDRAPYHQSGGVMKWRIVQGLDRSLLDIVISHAMKWWSDEVEDCPDEMSTTLMLAPDDPGEMRCPLP